MIAVTGGTGFLGLHLVRELLGRHPSVTLLTHAGSADAVGRVTRFLALVGAPPRLIAEAPDRIRVVETDLAEPRLGLTKREFQELADGLDQVWHSAGLINLDGDLPTLRDVNVAGTRHMLELAAAGAQAPVFHHMSTAFVAGARPDPIAYEDDLDGSHGFENHYERSKYEAELLVREWSRTHSRPVVVLRPSILVTDRPPHPDLPAHPLAALTRSIRTIEELVRSMAPEPLPSERLTVRAVGDPAGHLNFVPVEDAARAMVRISQRAVSGTAPGAASGTTAAVSTFHVVHDHEVPVPVLLEVVEHLIPVRVQLVTRAPADMTRLERVGFLLPGFAPYLRHRHVFDDTRARTLLGERPPGTPVDRDYLLAGIGAGQPPGPASTPSPVPTTPRSPAPTPATETFLTETPATGRPATHMPPATTDRSAQR
jgi:nucleoside-diphosphate-sugar epimerase